MGCQLGFWEKAWHRRWIKKQYDKIYDKVESLCEDGAVLEVQTLGMECAPELRSLLHKQFGGSGDDVRSREKRYELGMPESKGLPAFPVGVNIEDKLRSLHAECVALKKICKASLRDGYLYGKKTKLVQIVMHCLENTEYQKDIDDLLQEVKLKKNLMARLPVINAATGLFELPPAVDQQQVTDDWDYRNYSDDWLPEWEALKSKLVSSYKAKIFASADGGRKSYGRGDRKSGGNTLPVMITPGFGSSPRPNQYFGYGEVEHQRADGGPPVLESPYESSASVLWEDDEIDSESSGEWHLPGITELNELEDQRALERTKLASIKTGIKRKAEEDARDL